MKKIILKAIVVSVAMLTTFSAMAEPRTVKTSISNLRGYSTGTFFVTLATSALADGNTCNRTYAVRSDEAGAKNVIASVLTAYALGQDIQVEIPTAGGCTGFGTGIQSIIIAP